MELYSSLMLGSGNGCTGEVGGYEAGTSVSVEPLLGYHPSIARFLTCSREPAGGQCLAGSLTGAVASERVSEALKVPLRMDGNHP